VCQVPRSIPSPIDVPGSHFELTIRPPKHQPIENPTPMESDACRFDGCRLWATSSRLIRRHALSPANLHARRLTIFWTYIFSETLRDPHVSARPPPRTTALHPLRAATDKPDILPPSSRLAALGRHPYLYTPINRAWSPQRPHLTDHTTIPINRTYFPRRDRPVTQEPQVDSCVCLPLPARSWRPQDTDHQSITITGA
jgi:hypothetical protein